MKIALCLSLKDATTPQLRDPEYCKQFVGASWIPEFIKLAESQGHEVSSGSDLLKDYIKLPILSWVPKGMEHFDYPISVIQEDRSPIGRRLIKLGATPLINFCVESPLYVPSWYDHRNKYEAQFKHVLTTKELGFPSFDSRDPLPDYIPWNLRKPFVMVASNKYYRYTSVNRLQRKMSRSPAWKHAIENQLQDKRYEAITYLKGLGLLDLYGHGWPPGYAEPVSDKISVMSKYKFAICFENVSMEGYMTEKIVDCFLAGVIPIYLGDPCINMRIPKDCYFDFRNYKDWGEFLGSIEMLAPHYADYMIAVGRNWLKSKDGLGWTYKGFAQKILQLCSET